MECQPTAPDSSRGSDRSVQQRCPLCLESLSSSRIVPVDRVPRGLSSDEARLDAATEGQYMFFKLALSASIRDRGIVQLFIYLQLLDFLTTLVGFKVGAAEASPFIRLLMHAGPATGVAVSKLIALGLGGFCLCLDKHHLLRWATYWYGGLVVWNLMMLLASPIHSG